MDKAVEAARKALRLQGCNTNTMCSFMPCPCVERAITAADEARAVTDEEVIEVMITDWMTKAEPTAIPEGILKQYRTHRAIELVAALHAAGLKVVRA